MSCPTLLLLACLAFLVVSASAACLTDFSAFDTYSGSLNIPAGASASLPAASDSRERIGRRCFSAILHTFALLTQRRSAGSYTGIGIDCVNGSSNTCHGRLQVSPGGGDDYSVIFVDGYNYQQLQNAYADFSFPHSQ